MTHAAGQALPTALVRISLREFRTYGRLDLELGPGLVVMAGPNGIGKTNFLEACALLLGGVSPRTSAELRCVREGASFLRVAGALETGMSVEERAVTLEPGRGKRLERNGTAVRSVAEFANGVPIAVFLPERLLVVRGAPARRRALLDRLVEQSEAGGTSTLRDYTHAVTQRNALLRQAKSGRDVTTLLAPWDEQLVTLGTQVRTLRERTLDLLVPRLTGRFEQLTSLGGAGVSVDQRGIDIRAGLADTATLERRRGTTLVGPHLDDVRIEQEGRDLRSFGSTGEQRAALLAWSLGSADMLRDQLLREPILLLDEPYAELDADRRRRLSAALTEYPQVILTTTEPPSHLAEAAARGEAVTLLKVSSGQVSPWTTDDDIQSR